MAISSEEYQHLLSEISSLKEQIASLTEALADKTHQTPPKRTSKPAETPQGRKRAISTSGYEDQQQDHQDEEEEDFYDEEEEEEENGQGRGTLQSAHMSARMRWGDGFIRNEARLAPSVVEAAKAGWERSKRRAERLRGSGSSWEWLPGSWDIIMRTQKENQITHKIQNFISKVISPCGKSFGIMRDQKAKALKLVHQRGEHHGYTSPCAPETNVKDRVQRRKACSEDEEEEEEEYAEIESEISDVSEELPQVRQSGRKRTRPAHLREEFLYDKTMRSIQKRSAERRDQKRRIYVDRGGRCHSQPGPSGCSEDSESESESSKDDEVLNNQKEEEESADVPATEELVDEDGEEEGDGDETSSPLECERQIEQQQQQIQQDNSSLGREWWFFENIIVIDTSE